MDEGRKLAGGLKEFKRRELNHPDFDEEGKMDETVNVITEFNKAQKTSLIRPIIYRFDEDVEIYHHVNFSASVMGVGLDNYYDLRKFKHVIRK